MKLWRRYSLTRSLILVAIAIFIALAIILSPSSLLSASPRPSPPDLSSLAPPHSHPLPSTLARWRNPKGVGDYFDQVKPAIVGALVWSSFPVTVYVEPLSDADQASPFLLRRSQTWIKAVQTAVQEWNVYLPLKQVAGTEADIQILRSTPPLRLEASGDRGLPIPRARSAETRFELYAKRGSDTRSLLAHRMTIYIRPDQATDYTQATARHELGHALGIWGHSPNQTDALYFSQVRNPAKISDRDINTLKRVYEQPTRLGWKMSN